MANKACPLFNPIHMDPPYLFNSSHTGLLSVPPTPKLFFIGAIALFNSSTQVPDFPPPPPDDWSPISPWAFCLDLFLPKTSQFILHIQPASFFIYFFIKSNSRQGHLLALTLQGFPIVVVVFFNKTNQVTSD